MTNRERARRLFQGAEWSYQDMQRALEQGIWNIAVRRAQETVELVLKGLLCLMGVDYPLVHDVGGLFVRVVRERGVALPEQALTRIEEISAALARRRAPAFYFEEDISEDEAHRAAQDADTIWRWGQEWFNLLMGEQS